MNKYINTETIYLPSIEEHVTVEFEFVKDKDEWGEYSYVFYGFKMRCSYPTANESMEEMKLWAGVTLTAEQIVEAEHALDAIRKERGEPYKYD